MYISLDTLWKVGYIILSVIHIVIYLIIFVKLHKLNAKPDVLTEIKEKLKTAASGLLNAFGGDLTGVLDKLKQIKNGNPKDDDKKDGESNG